ncbi:winged helix-turn-helix domain-containing protein [Methylobacterium aquaticum]|uniref:winged helix-turn-helix domain-containing protein n=1 Tax=Methylobacterium aquaticum TaxID=270351 RepID=UPI003D16A6A4
MPSLDHPGAAGQVVTRALLFEEGWSHRVTPRSNLIDVHLGRLRRKLEAGGASRR